MAKKDKREKTLGKIEKFVFNRLHHKKSAEMNQNYEVYFDNESVIAAIKSPNKYQCKILLEESKTFITTLKSVKDKKIFNYAKEIKNYEKISGRFILFLLSFCFLTPFIVYITHRLINASTAIIIGAGFAIICLLGAFFNMINVEELKIFHCYAKWYNERFQNEE